MLDVSVVIPTYRREQLVLEAISSAVTQRDVELEVIVVDDSLEGTARAGVEALGDARVRYVQRSTPSKGVVALVRNDGAALSRARLLHFLDDDDRLVAGALSALAQPLSKSGTGMAFGRVVPFGNKPALTEKMQAYYRRAAAAGRRIRGRRWFAAQMLFFEWPLVNSACMIRRDVFEASGGYEGGLNAYADIEFYLRVGRADGVTFVDRDVLEYRVGSPSMTDGLLELDDVPQIRDEYRKLNRWYRDTYGDLEYRTLQVLSKAAKAMGPKVQSYPA